jgi:hypothetical protein
MSPTFGQVMLLLKDNNEQYSRAGGNYGSTCAVTVFASIYQSRQE